MSSLTDELIEAHVICAIPASMKSRIAEADIVAIVSRLLEHAVKPRYLNDWHSGSPAAVV